MAQASLQIRVVEPAPRSHASDRAVDSDLSVFRTLRARHRPEMQLALRAARADDGDALQTYVRGLSPMSRYNRFLGAASELPTSQLERALAVDGREFLTLLLTSTVEYRETVVGEARVALSCVKRAGEFSMSIADDWQHLGLGSALLQEIERRAAADGIELLFGDTLRTNKGMIGLARGCGFQLGPGFEPRVVRIQKRLMDVAPDVPCRKWNETADGAAAD